MSVPDWLNAAHVVDIALLVLTLELLVWIGLAVKRASMQMGRLFWNLLAGILLLSALRSVVSDAPWPWMAGFLTGALIAHVLDLRHRLRSSY